MMEGSTWYLTKLFWPFCKKEASAASTSLDMAASRG
jgi:hypothetical protein